MESVRCSTYSCIPNSYTIQERAWWNNRCWLHIIHCMAFWLVNCCPWNCSVNFDDITSVSQSVCQSVSKKLHFPMHSQPIKVLLYVHSLYHHLQMFHRGPIFPKLASSSRRAGGRREQYDTMHMCATMVDIHPRMKRHLKGKRFASQNLPQKESCRPWRGLWYRWGILESPFLNLDIECQSCLGLHSAHTVVIGY